MKQTLTFLTLAFLSFGLLAFDAEAKRMGGGKNIGTQRQSVNQQQAAPNTQKAAPAATPAAAPSAGSKWGGALAGLAAGGLLAALFMGGAFENINMMDFVIMALLIGVVFFVIRMLRKPRAEHAASMQYSGMGAAAGTQDRFNTPPFTAPAETASGEDSGSAYQQPNIPADFKVEPFIRNAKASFIRLQAAHDRGDINEIRDFTTAEMLAEISEQMQERGDTQQKSEVMFIDANLLEVETTEDMAIASVRFTGQLRELPNGEPEAFDEIWHVQKDLKDPNATWLLSGIQQVS
ncbi:MAG: Tim44-like domain-containing protein [Nitrosomonas sp.]|uniref:Tim44 domain-containing protein n=1 Tax=Nitrosomonas sp. TaxID=42353 RepID=UPI0025DDE57A|nr:Tim44-like domain-containing protein [Nitrosomonas sp.]MCG7757390.1 Tim44-like domain-containing protein [Nitrosomonas sp.]UJP04327.1 MAG: Tim44-like domain-containing protein [Nitrosomonas sp.]